jgi:hypothetical protein
MPLSDTSEKVMQSMQKQYGKKKGESVFYATANKKGGRAEAASTWKKKQKAAEALTGVLCKAAGLEKRAQGQQGGLMSSLGQYLPYMALGGLGNLMLGDDETPWW